MNPSNTYASEFSLRGHSYRVSVTAPWGAEEYDRPGLSQITLMEGHSVSTAWILASDAFVRIYLVTGDHALPGSAVDPFLKGSPPSAITAELEKAGRDAKTSFRAVFVEIGGSQEDLLIQVCTAGLPPLVLLSGGDFTLPVRSGVPAGVVPERRIFPQSMEWNIGDALVMYTDYSGPEGNLRLRDFHEALKSGDVPVPKRGIAVRVEFAS